MRCRSLTSTVRAILLVPNLDSSATDSATGYVWGKILSYLIYEPAAVIDWVIFDEAVCMHGNFLSDQSFMLLMFLVGCIVHRSRNTNS
jgi:hypothetical protein